MYFLGEKFYTFAQIKVSIRRKKQPGRMDENRMKLLGAFRGSFLFMNMDVLNMGGINISLI